VPGFHATLWVGFMAPAHTPQPVVDLLNRTITTILQRPDIKTAWEKQGATPLVMSQQEFQTFMAAEVVKWAKVINDNHIATIK
jgi:tripartite-type tricarboxylate transporter receptor subunit TctC